jgi:hypothetical protein
MSRMTPIVAPVFQSIPAFCGPSELKNRSIHHQNLVTLASPVTRNGAASRGPTAIVFLNMSGPSMVDEVSDFLRRLFVRQQISG